MNRGFRPATSLATRCTKNASSSITLLGEEPRRTTCLDRVRRVTAWKLSGQVLLPLTLTCLDRARRVTAWKQNGLGQLRRAKMSGQSNAGRSEETSLRANIAETLLLPLITEQGGKEIQHEEYEDILSGPVGRAQ